jgi:hypothetical protein
MQCGVCRIPFKSEYFGDDAILIQIYENKMREHRRNLNNNEIINFRMSQSNRSMNHSNIRYINMQSERDIQLNALSQNTDNTFIILFHPNKFICFAILLCNLIISGLGTLILGVKNMNLYDFFLSIMQFCFCYPFLSRALDIKEKKYLNDFKVNSFLWIFLICIASIFYLSSIYIGIFHNFIYFNPRKIKNKEKGITIIILNILMGGIGTIFYGIIAEGINCCQRIRMWIVGITQIFAFMFLIITISIFKELKVGIFVIFIIIGSLFYITSVFLGFRLYKRITTY